MASDGCSTSTFDFDIMLEDAREVITHLDDPMLSSTSQGQSTSQRELTFAEVLTRENSVDLESMEIKKIVDDLMEAETSFDQGTDFGCTSSCATVTDSLGVSLQTLNSRPSSDNFLSPASQSFFGGDFDFNGISNDYFGKISSPPPSVLVHHFPPPVETLSQKPKIVSCGKPDSILSFQSVSTKRQIGKIDLKDPSIFTNPSIDFSQSTSPNRAQKSRRSMGDLKKKPKSEPIFQNDEDEETYRMKREKNNKAVKKSRLTATQKREEMVASIKQFKEDNARLRIRERELEQAIVQEKERGVRLQKNLDEALKNIRPKI